MNKKAKLFGLFLLLPIWFYAMNPVVLGIVFLDSKLIRGILIILGLGLSYSLFHEKPFPAYFILTLLCSEFIAYEMESVDYYRFHQVLYLTNLYSGTILVISGQYATNFFTFILSPIHNFLKTIKINIPIAVIAGILILPFLLLSSNFWEWWENYRLYQRNINR